MQIYIDINSALIELAKQLKKFLDETDNDCVNVHDFIPAFIDFQLREKEESNPFPRQFSAFDKLCHVEDLNGLLKALKLPDKARKGCYYHEDFFRDDPNREHVTKLLKLVADEIAALNHSTISERKLMSFSLEELNDCNAVLQRILLPIDKMQLNYSTGTSKNLVTIGLFKYKQISDCPKESEKDKGLFSKLLACFGYQ